MDIPPSCFEKDFETRNNHKLKSRYKLESYYEKQQ
jgi:hypothetical protein